MYTTIKICALQEIFIISLMILIADVLYCANTFPLSSSQSIQFS